jgi:hydrogenase expression/formation protein HypC
VCLTAPVRILAVGGGMATVEVGGVERRASILATPDARPGDWALMSSGMLIRTVEPDLAAELAAAMRTATGEET